VPHPRLIDAFRLLPRALLGLGATAAAVFGYSALLSLAVQAGQPLAGTWAGTARTAAREVILELELHGRGRQVQGTFFDGTERVLSTAGQVEGDTVTLEFGPHATRLVATLEDGRLRGSYSAARGGGFAVQLAPSRRPGTRMGQLAERGIRSQPGAAN
jgi:hypothetical protein